MRIFINLKSWKKFKKQWAGTVDEQGSFKLEYDLQTWYLYTRVWGCEVTLKA
jgi:hypothetical protein